MRSPGAAAVLAIAASVVLAGVVGPGTASWRRSSVGWACLSIGFLLATWNGGMARRDATGACANSLRTGDPVSLSGLVTNRVRTGANARPILRLTDVEIRAGTRTCRAVSGLVRLAGGEDAPASGMRVRSHGEWVRRGEDTGWPRAPDRLGLVAGAEIDEVWYGGGSPAVRLRSTLAGRLAGRLPADVAPIGLALILAERDELDAETRRRFADAGLAHFLAISGMHVGLLATAALWLLGQFLGRRRRGITLCLIAAYVLMIGAPVAARRALLVFAGFLWARTRGWPTRSGDLLGAAGIVTLIHDPLSLSDPGFQLSFAGFAGVLVGARLSGLACAGTGTGWRAERGRALGRAVVISTCALLSTSPFTAWHFGQITPVAAVSHLVGAPLVAVALGSLVATMTLPELFSLPAAAVATGAIRLLQAAVDRLAVLPFGHATVSAPGAIVWATWMLVVLAIYRVVARGDARAAIGPALLAMAVIAVAPVYRQPGTEDTLLCTLSVGQGDAAVLRTRRGHWMVFDGGPTGPTWDAGRAVLIPFLRRHGASRVDVALLSHPDTDHLGGLASLVEEMTVRRVLDTGEAVPSRAYERFLAAVDESGAQWLPAAPGDRLRLDEAAIMVLGPSRSSGPGAATTNATSLSFRLSIDGGFRYLNTGDATSREEFDLLQAWSDDSLRADLMKVGHHGSRTSSSVPFVQAVNPSLAVISSGARNRYGHPHPQTLARLDSAGVPRVWRTDRNGTLCVEVDDRGWWRVRGEPGWRRPAASVLTRPGRGP